MTSATRDLRLPRLCMMQFVRATVDLPGGRVAIGVEVSVADFAAARRVRGTILQIARPLTADMLDEDAALKFADVIEDRLLALWQTRSWWFEIWLDGEAHAVGKVHEPTATLSAV